MKTYTVEYKFSRVDGVFGSDSMTFADEQSAYEFIEMLKNNKDKIITNIWLVTLERIM